MAEFSINCDVVQGYNFKKDEQFPVGYITSMTIGTVTLTADYKVEDPESPGSKFAVVAVLSHASWGYGVTEPIGFVGRLTVTNKQEVATLLVNDLSNIEVKFQVVIYDYDPKQKVYFKCLKPQDDSDLQGLVEKMGSVLNLSVERDASTDVDSPQNYEFVIGVTPQPTKQQIAIATASGKTTVKQWGVEEA